MIARNVTIINKLGLHARAAAKFVSLASRFNSLINLRHKGREVNGKSIMGIMMLAAAKGTQLELAVDGPDEAQAVQALCELIEDRFGEEE